MTRVQRLPGLAVLAFVCGCGHSPTAPSADPLSQQIESSHFVFHFAAGDAVDAAWEEAFHAWASAELGVANVPRITYNKYRTRQHMGQVIGVSNTNAYADPPTFTIHTIWPTDNHEVVHLYASAFGSPVALFSEGFAVAHQVNPPAGDFVPRWSGEPIHDAARRLRRAGSLVRIANLAETRGFRTFDANVTYPEAGSFVRFLLDRYGLARMKQVFAGLTPEDLADRIEVVVGNAYGRSLGALEDEWLTLLE